MQNPPFDDVMMTSLVRVRCITMICSCARLFAVVCDYHNCVQSVCMAIDHF